MQVFWSDHDMKHCNLTCEI